MKIKPFLIMLLTLGLLSHGAKAAIIITNFSLTGTSISFDISGTLPESVPPQSNFLILANPDIAANPGFVVLDNTSASSVGSTTIPTVNNIYGGVQSWGDYIGIILDSYPAGGSELSGNITATWSSTALDPSAVTSLDLYWGYTTPQTPGLGGTYLTSVAVPEPSTAGFLVGAGALVTAFARRRYPKI